MGNLREFTNGKKTYLVALSALITLIMAWSSKSITTEEFVKNSFGVILAITIRHGIAVGADKPSTPPLAEPTPNVTPAPSTSPEPVVEPPVKDTAVTPVIEVPVPKVEPEPIKTTGEPTSIPVAIQELINPEKKTCDLNVNVTMHVCEECGKVSNKHKPSKRHKA